MTPRSFRRALASALAVFLVLALAAPESLGAGTPRRTAPRRAAQTPSAAALIAILPPWAAPLAGLWLKEGCSIDPDGRCLPRLTSGGGPSDAGCSIDPDGLCGKSGPARPSIREEGCSIDPSGCAGAAPTGDNGCSIDPSGHCAPGH